jgi:hypothetical protein
MKMPVEDRDFDFEVGDHVLTPTGRLARITSLGERAVLNYLDSTGGSVVLQAELLRFVAPEQAVSASDDGGNATTPATPRSARTTLSCKRQEGAQ